jgi:3-methyl-2-oxobutanoate hydroxymethyltransferase
MAKLTVADLQQMKRDGKKIQAAICYEYQMAQIVDRAGVDLVTVGDTVGSALWGQPTYYEVSMDQMILTCLAVTRGVSHAVVNCDLPFGPVQEGPDAALRAAIRLVKEGHAEMVKLDNAPSNMDAVRAIVRAGIPLWPQFGFSPQSTMAIGDFMARTEAMIEQRRSIILRQAKELEDAGVSLLDLTGVTHELYAEVAKTVNIPVLGGQAGPEADGRISGFTARANGIDRPEDGRPNAGRYIYDAVMAAVEATRAGRF